MHCEILNVQGNESRTNYISFIYFLIYIKLSLSMIQTYFNKFN